MRYGLITIVGPTEEPLTLAEAKTHLRFDAGVTDEDALITDLIAAARERCQRVAQRALCTQTLKMTIDQWPYDTWIIRLPRSPVQSVASVKYIDAQGVQQTLDPTKYKVDATGEPARIAPVYGQWWPFTRWDIATVEITFVAGYGAAAACPKEIKERLKAYVGYCFINREQRDEAYLDSLFQQFWVGTY